RRRRLRHRLLTVCVAAMNVPRRTSVPLRNLSNRTSQSFRFLSLRKFLSNKRPKFECPERVRLPPVRPVPVACRGGERERGYAPRAVAAQKGEPGTRVAHTPGGPRGHGLPACCRESLEPL